MRMTHKRIQADANTTSYAFVTDDQDVLRVIANIYTLGKINLLHCSIYNRKVTFNIIYFSNFETFWGMPPKGSKGKKGKGKALVPPVLEPVDSKPAQQEADKATYVKPKKKKNHDDIYRAAEGRNHQLPHVVDKPVTVTLWVNRDRNYSKYISNNHNTSQQSTSVLDVRIRMHRHVSCC